MFKVIVHMPMVINMKNFFLTFIEFTYQMTSDVVLEVKHTSADHINLI
jgi:hypothetical protein